MDVVFYTLDLNAESGCCFVLSSHMEFSGFQSDVDTRSRGESTKHILWLYDRHLNCVGSIHIII